MQRLPSVNQENGQTHAQKKPITFVRYAYVVIRSAAKEAWDAFGLNWKTTATAIAYVAILYWRFHNAGRESIVIAIFFKWSYLVEAIPPTLITIGGLTILFIVKAAYLLHKEQAEGREKLAELLFTETAKSNPTHKLTFILDTYPGRSSVQLDDNGLEDESDATAYCLSATLQLSFMNTDINPVLIVKCRCQLSRRRKSNYYCQSLGPSLGSPMLSRAHTLEAFPFQPLTHPQTITGLSLSLTCLANAPSHLTGNLF